MAIVFDSLKRLVPGSKTQGRIIRILIVVAIIFLGLGKAEVVDFHRIASVLEQTSRECIGWHA